jgi:hypothetical protein
VRSKMIESAKKKKGNKPPNEKINVPEIGIPIK